MHLTPDQYTAVILPLTGLTPRDKNRRRAYRMVVRTRTFITPVVGPDRPQTPVKVMVEDFSPRGVCIISATKLETGSEFIMQITRDGGISTALLCTIVHNTTVSEGVYRHGAEFVCTLPDHKPSEASSEKDAERIRDLMLK
jgi:hypothetical protein